MSTVRAQGSLLISRAAPSSARSPAKSLLISHVATSSAVSRQRPVPPLFVEL